MKENIIIIPAYNEERHIYDLSRAIKEMGYSILVIDDCSDDSTAELAASAGAILLRHPSNMGYGVALQTGYKYALGYGYKYLVQIDGDGQHDPKYIPDVLKPVIAGEADLCIGSRFLGFGDYRPPYLRRIGMALFRTILRIITGKIISDPTSGFQAMNRRTFAYLSKDFFPDDYPDADVIYMLLRAGARLKEVPIAMNYNHEKSMHGKITSNIYYILKINLLLLTYCFKKIKKL